jgi:hypothetical protein
LSVPRPARKRPTQLSEALRVLAILDLLMAGVEERDWAVKGHIPATVQAELLKVAERVAARTEAA